MSCEVTGVDAELILSSAAEYYSGLVPHKIAREDIGEVINNFTMAS